MPRLPFRTAFITSVAASLLSLCGSLITSAAAQSITGNDGAQLALGVGVYDVLHDKTAGGFDAEYRFGSKLSLIRPFVGGEVTSSGSTYGYGGLGFEVFLGDNWVVTPNAAVGAFARGDGKKLGSWVEFRTGAELGYRFDDQSRLGLDFHHISNAGLTSHNPGTEEISLVYSIPLPGLP